MTPVDSASYRMTFWFTAFYFLIAHGRGHLVIPFLSSLPCAMIAGLLAVVSFLMERKKEKYVLGREEKIVLGLLAMCLLTLPTAYWRGGSFSALYKGFLPVVTLMFITISICKDTDFVRKFIWIYFWTCSAIVSVALSKDLNHFSTGVTDLYDVNDIALVLDCSLPIIFFFIFENRGLKKFLLIIGLILYVLTVIKTASRGGILGLIVICSYLVYNSSERIKYFLVACVAVSLLVLISPESTKERFSTMLNPQTEYDQNLGDRIQIWSRGAKLFLDSPFLGVGLNNYSIADGGAKELGSWRTAHNSFLQISVELGIVGLILFVKLTFGTFVKFRRLRKEMEAVPQSSDLLWLVKGIEISLLVYLITAAFLSQAYNAQFFFIISIAIAVQKILSSQAHRLTETGLFSKP